jgi:hypothetical protein
MTAAAITATGFSDVEHRAQLRRALFASTVGTLIEWYDFLLYGTVTALIFGKLYFPHSTPLVGVLEAFSVFFIGFVGRPIGAAIFGHWGDRIGRKATLIVIPTRDRPLDRRCRPRSDLRVDRDLGCHLDDRHPPDPGDRSRR